MCLKDDTFGVFQHICQCMSTAFGAGLSSVRYVTGLLFAERKPLLINFHSLALLSIYSRSSYVEACVYTLNVGVLKHNLLRLFPGQV